MATAQKGINQLALITGASSGIGRELAKVFAKNGFELIVCAENEEIRDAEAELIQMGVKVHAFQIDLSQADGVTELYHKCQTLKRPLDIAVLNAGVGEGGDFARQTSLEKELNIIDLNVRSTVQLAKLILQDMTERGEGRLMFTSSIAAMMPGSFQAVYNASKAFIQSFAQALREELKDSGVIITSLQPGATETEFFDKADLRDTRLGQMDKDDAAKVAQEGFDALMDGKDYVISGTFMNKVLSSMGKLLPEKAAAKLHRKLAEPGSAKNSSPR